MQCRRTIFALILSMVSVLSGVATAQNTVRSSANYSISIEAFGEAGAAAASALYTHDGGSLGAISNGIVSSAHYASKTGYSGAQPNATSLTLALLPTTISEGASRLLAASLSLDDATQIALAGTAVTWSVLSGPISSISTMGAATAGTVYQDTAASVQGVAGTLNASLSLTVVNVNADDIPGYAGDGLDDAWQVQYFGFNNPQAAPGADADGDGETNAFEFTAGLVPTDPASRFTLAVGSVAGQPMLKALVFTVVPGRTYAVEYKNGITDAAWQPLTGATQSDNGTTRTVTDNNAVGPTRFYRVQISMP
jgi:hypothetical protein